LVIYFLIILTELRIVLIPFQLIAAKLPDIYGFKIVRFIKT